MPAHMPVLELSSRLPADAPLAELLVPSTVLSPRMPRSVVSTDEASREIGRGSFS